MKKVFLGLLALLLVLVALPTLADSRSLLVMYVTDGDTIKVRDGKKVETIRLIGIDTPEIAHGAKPADRYGPEAKSYVMSRLLGRNVTLEYDKQRYDKYGRTLAYVYQDNKMFNLELVQLGYASVFTVQPNIKYSQQFIQAEIEARSKRVGMWGDSGVRQGQSGWYNLPLRHSSPMGNN